MLKIDEVKIVIKIFDANFKLESQYLNESFAKPAESFISKVKSDKKILDAWNDIVQLLSSSKQKTVKKHLIKEKIKEILEENPRFAKLLEELYKEYNKDKVVHSVKSTKNPFENWRSDKTPTFDSNPISLNLEDCPEEYKDAVRIKCIQQYQKAMQLMEHTLSDVSLGYTVRKPAGPGKSKQGPFEDKFRNDGKMTLSNKPGAILQYANVYSQRYLDLYEAYIDWEIQNDIPMLPVTAGQMKLHGFTSEEIIKMQPSCAAYSAITDNIKSVLEGDFVAYGKIIAVMVGLDKNLSCDDFINQESKRNKFLEFLPLEKRKIIGDKLAAEFASYKALPDRALLDRAHFLMHDFAHLEYTDIAMQLYYVGIMQPKKNASKEERLQMEIRHRIGGDMSIHQNSPGTLGGNPLAYLNMLKSGEPGNPIAEFREKMYFVYMNNHFANAVISDESKIDFINKWLKRNGKGWNMDNFFIDEMKKRGAQYIPPIFRYGANAAINRQLRDVRSHDEVKKFYQDNPNITIREVMEGSASINSYYRMKLSDRELMNQIGESRWDSTDVNRGWQQLNFGTGAAVFKLYDTINEGMSPAAKEYLKQVNELSLPVFAGVSGTLDQSTAMAGLVGLGTDFDLARRELEIETIKLAYLAFMLPGRGHSAHEILQSSKTYGLEYVAGPGYEKYVYRPDQEHILSEIQKVQKMRGSNLPSYYLSPEYVEIALREVKEEASLAPTIPADSSSSNEDSYYYIGLSLAATPLGKLIQEYQRDSSIGWVNPSDLHITLGWMDPKISPAKQALIAKKLTSIFENYHELILSVNNVELWNEKKDVVINLNDKLHVLNSLQEEIKVALNELGVPFEFHSPHIKIGYSQHEIEPHKIERLFKGLSQNTYSFDHCNIMHYDTKNSKQQIDRTIGFGKYAENSKAKQEKLARHRKKSLVKKFDTHVKKTKKQDAAKELQPDSSKKKPVV